MTGKFVVKREEVCGGSLIQSGSLICRGMLFKVDEVKSGNEEKNNNDIVNKISKDLIFTSPGYAIENFNLKFDLYPEFKIYHYVVLNELLKYLGYGAELTQNDLNHIFRRLIANDWWLNHNMALFGWKKDENTISTSYSPGGIELVPRKIYDELHLISCTQNGKPSEREPNYSYIKRIR